MKMTMHIDEALLNRVMAAYACVSKTEAVEMALREMDRRTNFTAFVKEGLGFTPDELADAVDPDYDVHSLRAVDDGAGGKRAQALTPQSSKPKAK